MKGYEKTDKLTKDIGWMGYKRERRKNQVQNLKDEFERTKAYHATIEKGLLDEIKRQEKDLDQLDAYVDDLKKQLKEHTSKGKKTPPPKEVPKAPEKNGNGNGKVKCKVCGEEFAPQGIRAHEIACRRRQLEEELQLIDKQLGE